MKNIAIFVLILFTIEVYAQEKQLNISILIDLSDRIDPKEDPVTPSHKKRDIEIIKSITEIFKAEMKEQGAFFAKGKMRVFFHPSPQNTAINEIVQKLNVDLSTIAKPVEKKQIYNTITQTFEEQLSLIYDEVIEKDKYFGSDIWRFFKNDVKDYCIDSSPEYRNVLILVTDGYIYHQGSKDRIENRTAYITPGFFQREGFRKNPNWEQKYEQEKYGLLVKEKGLENLEVLVLEIAPSQVSRNDEDIIKRYLEDWFNGMGVKRFALYNTDLPNNTNLRLNNYFKKGG